jgi:hypothetical protein
MSSIKAIKLGSDIVAHHLTADHRVASPRQPHESRQRRSETIWRQSLDLSGNHGRRRRPLANEDLPPWLRPAAMLWPAGPDRPD